MAALHARLVAFVLCLSLLLLPLSDAARSTTSGHSKGHSSASGTPPPTGTQSSTNNIKTQLPTLSTASFVNASTGLAPQPTNVPVVKANTKAPYTLEDSVMVRSDLPINATNGLFFKFNTTINTPIFVSLSLCDGPRIPPYDTSNSTLLNELNMNEDEARQATLVSLFVSDKWSIPRPNADSGLSSSLVDYAQGGWAEVQLPKGSKDGIWIGVFPPTDPRGLDGVYRIQLSASTHCA